jgi:hypothetical protein
LIYTTTRLMWFWVPSADLEKVETTALDPNDGPLGGLIV